MAEKFKNGTQEAYIEPEYKYYDLIIDTSSENTEVSIKKIVRIMQS